MTPTPTTTAYLRVSTTDQDIEKNKFEILQLANDKQLTAALNISEAEWRALNSIQLINEVSKDGYVQLLITIRAVSGERPG